ncbi:DUF1471 domain-containing protein [Entomohabitans teleogrylli]|uniref:DUF1471 domain-containing protein n=1 Tax=Entomohabitans teleogrylli TaxID=1384589 RepID=UPI00073D7A04|nr:DUF1471 domain-containing protein [Entomohabitans teleogrylli]
MKKFSAAFVAISALFATQVAFAADEISSAQGKEKIGVVSVQGKNSLSEVSKALEQKAEEAGATSFKIVAVGGNNKQFGVADIYR